MRTTHLLDIRHTTAEEVSALDRTHFPDPTVGALFFSLFHAGEQHTPEYLAAYERLNVFDTWPSTRCRILDEVTDATFDLLFATQPEQLREECSTMLQRCTTASSARYTGPCAHLEIQYEPSSGTPYTGFEPYEYNLPAGEVAFQPTAINGTVSFRGWLIGTIPFGQKYGRIREGQLTLTFADRQITRVDGSGPLVHDLENAFDRSPGLRQVNEFGIGLHRAAAETARKHNVGLQWMEKCRGLHLGIGAELSEHIEDHRTRRTHHHLDLVFETGQLAIGSTIALTWP